MTMNYFLMPQNSQFLQGSGINFSNLTHSKMHNLVHGEQVAAKFAPASEARYLIMIYL